MPAVLFHRNKHVSACAAHKTVVKVRRVEAPPPPLSQRLDVLSGVRPVSARVSVVCTSPRLLNATYSMLTRSPIARMNVR
jgi:hypothetical protein